MSDKSNTRSLALVKLTAATVAAGALVAGLMLPFVGGSGLVARNSASLLDALPVELTDKTPSGNTKVLAADNSPITELYSNNRTPVTSDQIAPVMKQALVDIEDSRFYQHNGLDVQGTARALAANVAAGSVQEGGSTLTQQLVKQTLLQTAETPEEAAAATQESLGRKLKEARLALALEETYSKDEILTRYLNIVYFGHGAYGIQAAARTYFSVNAADLTLPQAAVLAGLVQSPANDDPLANPEAATTRRNQVLQRMFDLGNITEQEFAEVSASPIATVEGPKPPNGCISAAIGGHFCSYLVSYLTGTLGLSENEIENGGWTIKTTLRPDMQIAGDAAVRRTLPETNSLAGIYTAVQPGSGAILAMSVNRRYCDDPADATCESVVLNDAASQGAGSTYKVFTAAAALAQRYSQYYTLTTGNSYTSRVYKNAGRPYPVKNAGNYPATLDMEKALYMSSNTYFLALEDELGSVQAPVETAVAMGMNFNRSNQTPAEQIIAENRGSFTFGSEATSPLDLTSAYATLAANGTRCTPTPVLEITDRNGKPVLGDDGQPLVKNDNCTPEAIPAGVATTMNQILRKDVEPGYSGQTGERAYVPGHQIAGKTGTSQNNYSATFVGYTPEYTASVMVLNPKENQNVGGFGGNKPATIWHDAMKPILDQAPTAAFPPADPAYANGNTKNVPRCSGATSCQSALQAAGFRPVTQRVDSAEPEGTVVRTSPPAGSRAVPGQTVTIQVSNGSGDDGGSSAPNSTTPGPDGTNTRAPEDFTGDGIPD